MLHVRTARPIALLALAVVAVGSSGTFAQTLEQRIEHMRNKQQKADVNDSVAIAATTGRAMTVPVQVGGGALVDIQANVAFEWLSRAIDVPILVNWRSLEVLGIDPAQPVSIVGRNITGEMALNMVVQQLDVDGQLMWEPTGTYIRVFTKEQANREQIVRVYGIGDLLMTVPNFDNAPSFDLVEVTRSPASGGGNTSSPFEDADEDEQLKSKEERGNEIADIIRETIEPDIWRLNGGLGGSIRYWNENLIVRAPAYIHRQIAGDNAYAPAAVTPAMRISQPGRDAVLVQKHADPVRAAVRKVHNDRVFGDVVFTSAPADNR